MRVIRIVGSFTAVLTLSIAAPAWATDTDGDGLADSEESTYGTSVNLADTDDDRIEDGAEAAYWGARFSGDPDNDDLSNILDPDSDGDGFVDGREIQLGTDPADPVSQPLSISWGSAVGNIGTYSVALTDTDKYVLWILTAASDSGNDSFSITAGGITQAFTSPHGSGSPVWRRVDISGAPVMFGLASGTASVEVSSSDAGATTAVLLCNQNDLSPVVLTDMTDVDGDNITDIDELTIYGTSPDDADTDLDGINDGVEIALWGAEWAGDYNLNGISNLTDPDADGDGTPDGVEVAQGTNPADPLFY